MENLRDLAENSNAWPFAEARNLIKRLDKMGKPQDEPVVFETGYGPSGLPHIGTFGEVARTTMVRQAFQILSDRPTRLVSFSDDMDGFRKVAPNLPNQEMLTAALGLPMSKVPDPFGSNLSFGETNNNRLKAFLDGFGFEYEFLSSTDCYSSGQFDETLLKVLERYDAVINVILPTLGEERRKTYSPFLPICPKTGHVLQVPVVDRNVEAGTITYEEEDGTCTEVPVTGGHCKLQWKVDWAMRWVALGVDYEMAGKDLIDSVNLSGKITRILGATPPAGFSYEMFLDDKGAKISKSKGNGIAIEEWLKYATPESLSLYMFQSPRKAKRLYFDVIPKAVDEYIKFLDAYSGQEPDKQLANPAWHIHNGNPPTEDMPVTFGLLLNLVGASHADSPAKLWSFISQYAPGATPENHPLLDRLVGYAIAYYEDFVAPTKSFRAPEGKEVAAIEDLLASLEGMEADASAEDIMTEIYEIGKRHEFDPLREWFKTLYETLLGQSQGPRMGSFIALYGIENSKVLIAQALKGELA